jgi:hypothetical protein
MLQRTLAGLFCLFLISIFHPAEAQVSCNDSAYRQFDFWLGEWEVRKPDGTLAGTNRIEKEYGGCVLHERYKTATGYSGESLNTYDAARKVWHQTWVDNGGLLLLLDGHFSDGRMVLEGPGQAPDGAAIRHRISWTPSPDGTVRQFWESTDAGGKWTVAFDGIYKRIKP